MDKQTLHTLLFEAKQKFQEYADVDDEVLDAFIDKVMQEAKPHVE